MSLGILELALLLLAAAVVVVRTVDDEADRQQPRLHSVVLPPGAAAVGRALKDLDFAALGVGVTATRRRNLRSSTPDPETRLAEGDVIGLRGTQAALEATDLYLMQGGRGKKIARDTRAIQG